MCERVRLTPELSLVCNGVQCVWIEKLRTAMLKVEESSLIATTTDTSAGMLDCEDGAQIHMGTGLDLCSMNGERTFELQHRN